MTEEQTYKAYAIWERLHVALNSTVFAVLDSADITIEQEDYIINKLHEGRHYWRD